MEVLLGKLKLIPAGKRAALAAAAAALTLAGWFALRLINESGYETLYSGLSSEDAGRIVAKLKEAKVPYRLGSGGATVLVPSEKVDEFRLALASQGLPSSGGVGFELFDKTKLGVSGFAEKVQFRRALEGELSRTLSRMDGVRAARVHLALPEPTPFAAKQAGATASVILHLAPGAGLSASQVRGVVNLVSGAVEGLPAEGVSVLDGQGRLLQAQGGDAAGAGNELKAGLEKELETRGQELLEKLYGRDKSLVRVDVALDMDKLQSVREVYDPDTRLVRSSRETRSAGEGGAPGPSESQTTYELNKKVETFIKTPGGVRKISAAVIINDPQATPEQVDKVQQALSAALGIDEERGDVLTVENMSFTTVKIEEFDAGKWEKEASRQRVQREMLRYGAILLSAIIMAGALFGASRMLLRALASAGAAAPGGVQSALLQEPAASSSAAARPRGAQSTVDVGSMQVTLSSMASDKPEVFNRALKKFMTSEASKGSQQKEAAGVN